MTNEILGYLKTIHLPNERMEEEDMNINDWACGNMDDAYSMGCTDGKQEFIETLINRIETNDFELNRKKILPFAITPSRFV
jgi:hypothetical protein